MFNQVKTKLTIIFTLSLVLLLISFIGILYFIISHEIQEKQVAQIEEYFAKEKGEYADDLDEDEYHGIEYDPNRSLFYYIYNQKGERVYGEESVKSLSEWLDKHLEINKHAFIKRVQWDKYHILLVKKTLNSQGFVILGMDITAENHLIQKITWTLFMLTILFSCIYAVVGYYFAGQAIKPIRRAFLKQEKFVSDASHELRTPLSIFYSSVDLLIREEKSNLSEFGQEVLEDVKTEAQLMRNLVQDLLDLARSDKNQLTFEIENVNLSELVNSICKRFSRITSDHIQLEKQIETDIYLYCDEVRIQQLLYILLDNAFRYTKEGKVIVTLTEKMNQKIILVKDTGCGIAQGNLPYIFDRFFREDDTREKGGAGLGLAIAKSIVTAHAGDLQVSSIKGEGSVFTVIFSNDDRQTKGG